MQILVKLAAVALFPTIAALAAQPASAPPPTSPKRIYLAPDDHTDYMWAMDETNPNGVMTRIANTGLGIPDCRRDPPAEIELPGS